MISLHRAPVSDKSRTAVFEKLMRRNIRLQVHYIPLHLQPFYQRRFEYENGDFPIAESISTRTIALPFHNRLHDTELDLVSQTLKVMLQREQLLKR